MGETATENKPEGAAPAYIKREDLDGFKRETIELVKQEMGSAGEKIADQMRESNERIARIDKLIEQMPRSGSAGLFRSHWLNGLATGKPLVARHGATDEEVLEEGRERASALASGDYVDVGGVLLPVLRAGPSRRRAWAKDVDERALAGMRMWRALAAGLKRGDGRVTHDAAIQQAREWGDGQLERQLKELDEKIGDLGSGDRERREQAARALGTATLGSGASLIAGEYFEGIVDFLHPQSVVLSMGVPTLMVESGQLSIPYFSDAVTVSMVGENAGANEDTPSDGRLDFARKIMQAVMALSKELIAESSYDIDAWAMMHLGAAMAAFKDLKLLRGDGSQHSPRGASYWADQATTDGDAHAFNRTLDTVPTIQTITDDATKALRLIEDSKVPQLGLGWIGKARTFYGLMAKRNATTSAEIWPELRSGSFYGRPFARTPQLPQNLAGDAAGTGTGNKTELYYGAWGNFVHLQTKALQVDVYPGGAYKDANGNVVSGITNREVVFTADDHFDFGAVYRGSEVVRIDSVDWGASA